MKRKERKRLSCKYFRIGDEDALPYCDKIALDGNPVCLPIALDCALSCDEYERRPGDEYPRD